MQIVKTKIEDILIDQELSQKRVTILLAYEEGEPRLTEVDTPPYPFGSPEEAICEIAGVLPTGSPHPDSNRVWICEPKIEILKNGLLVTQDAIIRTETVQMKTRTWIDPRIMKNIQHRINLN